MRRRTRAREAAIQFLYQADLRTDRAPDSDPTSGLDEFLDQAIADGILIDADSRTFATRLVRGTRQHLEEIDRILKQVARNWDLRRMAVVDRNVLRMVVFELLHCPDIPPKVTINEAIEIGKKFSTANSGGFINGILDRIRLDHAAVTPRAKDEAPAAAIEEGEA